MEGQKRARFAALCRDVAALEQGGRRSPALAFGVPAIDARLPGGGLPLGALHELTGARVESEDGAVATAFLAGILARLLPQRPVLWCARRADLYAPGLALHGLACRRLILARVVREQDILWAMEEGLRSPALAAVIGELAELPSLASRRLQLAAETSGVTAFVLRRGGEQAATSSAVTRWRLTALPGALTGEPGRPRWQVELLRCRSGRTGSWEVEAGDATGHVSLSAAMADRSPPRQNRLAG